MRHREAAFDHVLEVVRGMRLVLDTEMRGVTLALEVLGGSQALQRGDLEGFRQNAAAFLQSYPGQGISLAARDGQQLLNTGIAAGQPVPPRLNRDLDRESVPRPASRPIPTCSSARSRATTSSRSACRCSATAEVIYELSFNPPLSLFQRILTQQRPDDDWTMSIFDSNGINFARVPNPAEDHRAGRIHDPAAGAAVGRNEGKLNTMSLEGRRAQHRLHPLAADGWKSPPARRSMR